MPHPVPRVIRMLAQHGAKALEPTVTRGFYRSPPVKPRAAAMLRKRSVIDGSYGSFDPIKGGWNPEWDTVKKMYFLRPFRQHIRERNRSARADKITKALETTVPEKITKYKKEVNDRRPVKDIVYQFKRAANLAKSRMSRKESISAGKALKLERKKKKRSRKPNMLSDLTQLHSLKKMDGGTSVNIPDLE